MFLDLNGPGNLLGLLYWETLSPWRGGSSMLNTGASPNAAVESSLSQILQDLVPERYYLSRTACLGILRRARERCKELPSQLKAALMAQTGLASVPTAGSSLKAYHINQRDEGIDLGEVSGALMATSNMQMQTFVTQPEQPVGFDSYNNALTGDKTTDSNTDMVPSVLCLNDQGGSVMECTEDMTGTLRAQEHGHQPLVYENHGIDARYTGPHQTVPTLSARAGTGGNNLPLVAEADVPPLCIAGNIIDRQPQNGGNGLGYQEKIAYTLTATDRHAVFSRQRVDVFKGDDVVSTQSARQHKDATDLIVTPKVFGQSQYGTYAEGCSTLRAQGGDSGGGSENLIAEIGNSTPLLIRRLTPLECERLQGFPDGWTDLPDASDSARYKALGNSVAIPCVEYVMRGIALALLSSDMSA